VKVAITGGSGIIGQHLRQAFQGKYTVTNIDRIEPTENFANEHFCEVDLADLQSIIDSTHGIDCIVHLGANPKVDAAMPDLVNSNIVGTYNVFEAARLNKIPRVIFASTFHVTGGYPTSSFIEPDMPVHPDSIYACSKVFGEAIARFYSTHHQISSICVRIGSFQQNQVVSREDRFQFTWFSPADCVQLFIKCIETPTIPFAIFYGVSNNAKAHWSIKNAKDLLHYDPQDRAELHK
jgi:uronate dehydrogenase